MTSERRVKLLFKKWTALLGLDQWNIVIELAPAASFDAVGHLNAAATCSALWEYETATIRFNEDDVAQSDDEELEDTIVHELQHCMLNELRREHKMGNEERTATMLTRAFMKTGGTKA